MELKNYFKITEIGEIPLDWSLVSVNSITKFHKQGYYTTEQYKENSDYYLLRGTDMQNPRIDLSTTPKINASLIDYESYKVLIGDFLFVRSGSIGRYGIVTKEIPKSIFGSYLINFRFSETIDPNFFGYFYQSGLAVNQIKSITQGGGNLNINAENIKAIKIPLPPNKEEQLAIVKALSDADALINNFEKLIEKKKNIKQGTMQQLLKPKKGWEIKTIKEVATYRRGSFPQPYGLDKWYDDISGFPFIQVFDVDDNKRLKNETKRYISKAAQQMSVFVKKGSIILTIQGSIGRIAITQYDAYVDRTLLIFETFKVPFNSFFFMISIWRIFEIEKELAPGGIIKTITKEALSSFKISYPNIIEQERIANVLSDIDNEIFTLEEKLHKSKSIKQGMMQNLLTGKIRLV